MKRQEPARARYTVEETDSQLRITVPGAGRRGPAFAQGLILLVWCSAFLYFLGVGAMHSRAPRDVVFLLLGAPLLLGVLLLGAYRIVWALAGREVITLTHDAMYLSRAIGAHARTRRYELSGVTSVRIPLENGAGWAEFEAHSSGLERGIIQFDYHGSRRRFGFGLRVPEAQEILALIEPRVPRL